MKYGAITAIALVMILSLSVLWMLAPSRWAGAETQVTWPQVSLVDVTSGLETPVYLTHSGDGSGRSFIVELRGRIRILQNGKVNSTPFLDISSRVQSPFSGGGSEEGLLSVAFPPDYTQKGSFYVYYTNRNGDNQVSRFHLGTSADQANPQSEELILLLKHPTNANHNGGQLAFGPDGYLYIGTGDGGGGGDPQENAQNPGSLLGKLLRIDVESGGEVPIPRSNQTFLPLVFNSRSSQGTPAYQVPADNPFAQDNAFRPEIWALGLRNPWRFSFDLQTGDLYIADVGQGDWEEIDFQTQSSQGGENYGWDIMEGASCFEPANCSSSGLVLPVFTYRTHVNNTCAITGGFVYRGAAQPGLQGIYFYGDYCSGKVWGMQQDSGEWHNQELGSAGANITSFGQDEAGELYVLDSSGKVRRIVASGN